MEEATQLDNKFEIMLNHEKHGYMECPIVLDTVRH